MCRPHPRHRATMTLPDAPAVIREISNDTKIKSWRVRAQSPRPSKQRLVFDAGAGFLASPGFSMRATRIAAKFGTAHHPRRADSATGAGGLPPESHTHQALSLVVLGITLRCFRFGVPILGR